MKIFIYDESRALIRTVGTPDVMQGESNATLIFMSVAGIDQTNFQNYLAQFAATIGTSHPADVITDFGPYVLDGVTYYGWKYFVSSKFTQVAGVLNANLVLSNNGSTLISQTVSLNVNPSASGVTWFKNITQAQWEQLLAYCVGLRNPNLGVLSDEDGLDPYCNMGQAGAYLYVDDGGLSHLLFVGYDEAQDRVYQTDYYNNNGALICRQRYTAEGDEDGWENWVINSQASAISFDNASLPQLTGANTVQKAISALAHAVYPIALVNSLTPSPFTSVDVPNSKDKIIKDDLGQDLNAGGVLDYAFAIFGRNNTHAFSFDDTFIMTSDGAIYRMKYENGSMVAHWFEGSPAQVKAEQSAVNQTLSDGISTNNSLIKNNVVGNSAMTMDEDTYVITVTNTNLNGEVLSTYSIDIPAEMAFVSGRYDAEDRDLIFTLQNGNEVAVPVDDIFVGLATQDWVNTAIANALLPYATASWVDSNYVSLTKGGYVNLAEAPSSPNTYYFGAKNGTTSFLRLSDNSFDVKTTRGDVVMQFMLNFSNSNLARFVKIDGSTTPSTLSATDIPFKQGVHSLVLDDDLDEANTKINALETKTAKQESDIQYLYRQVIGGGDLVTATDSGVSLASQPFPLTVSPKALLDYVGGMCQKVNQLYNITDYTLTRNNVTITRSAATKTIVVSTNGTADAFNDLPIGSVRYTSGHKYFLHYNGSKTALALVIQQYNGSTWVRNKSSDANNNIILNYSEDDFNIFSFVLRFETGNAPSANMQFTLVDISDIWPTNTPTSTSDARIQWLMSYLSSHPEYDAGSIITAPVTKVVSKGFNLWDEQWELGGYNSSTGEKVSESDRIRNKNSIAVLPSTSYYFKKGGSGYIYAYYYDEDMNFIGQEGATNSIVTTPSNCRYVNFYCSSGYGTTYNHDICINISSSLNGTYMPWTPPIEYPIPAEVRALEGYGWGFDADCNNYTSFERKKQGKMVAQHAFQSGEWVATTANRFYSSSLRGAIKPSTLNLLVLGLTAVNKSSVEIGDYQIGVDVDGTIYVHLTDSSTLADVETFFAGKTMVYELATPTETDISEYIDSDVIIVSAGGRLEFENENDMGVPYSATYQCEPDTQGEGE